MPRFMILVKGQPDFDSSTPPSVNIYEEMNIYNEKLKAAGVLLSAEGFTSTEEGAYRVSFSRNSESGERVEPEVSTGPFDLSKESIPAGFWIIKTENAEEAVGWAKKIPFQGGEVMIRKIGENCGQGDAAEKAEC